MTANDHHQHRSLTETDKASLQHRGYTVNCAIIQGDHSTIYTGSHSSGKLCAIKQIDMSQAKVAHILTDMLTLKKLRPHPNVTQVFDFFLIKRQYLLVVAELASRDLHALLATFYLREVTAVKLYSQIGSGLVYLHKSGIAHRSLKPSNILLNAEKTVAKLADYGMAWNDPASGKLIKSGSCTGTLWYMAPEHLRIIAYYAEPAPQSIPQPAPFCPFNADIWSLGIILYEMLYGDGSLPYNPVGSSSVVGIYNSIVERVVVNWEPFRLVHGGIPISDGAVAFTKKHLQWRPEDRLSVEELLEDEWIANGGGGMAPPPAGYY